MRIVTGIVGAAAVALLWYVDPYFGVAGLGVLIVSGWQLRRLR
jgi:hypothetical protein